MMSPPSSQVDLPPMEPRSDRDRRAFAPPRNQIAIEEILRSRAGVRDLWAAWKLLVEEMPRPGAAVAELVALTLGEVAAQIGAALAIKIALDGASRGEGPDGRVVAAVMVPAALAFALVRARFLAQERLALTCRRRGVARLAKHINRAGYEDLAAVPMAALREILMTDVDQAYRFFIEGLGQAVVIGFWLMAAVALLAWLSPPLLALMMALGLACAAGIGLVLRLHLALTGERFRWVADLSQRAREVVEVHRIILARQFGIGNYFVRRFDQAHEVFLDVAMAQGRVNAVIRSSLVMLGALAFLALTLLGGGLIAAGALGDGDLVAMLFVVGRLLTAVTQAGDYVGRAAETATSGKRLAAYWEAPPALGRGSRGPATGQVQRISAWGLAFGYRGGPPVIEGLDLELERGRLAALTAETGAGKTTLALILAGILPPTEGRVAVDGHAALGPADLEPGRVLYVGSRPILFEGSVRDNLLLDGRGSAVLPAPALEAVLNERFGGRWTLPVDEPIIGPGGTGVSTGQSQLIQLARAVLRNPDVVILDEATSALDMATETAVQETLLDWCHRRVCLVISHRRCPWTERAAERLTL